MLELVNKMFQERAGWRWVIQCCRNRNCFKDWPKARELLWSCPTKSLMLWKGWNPPTEALASAHVRAFPVRHEAVTTPAVTCGILSIASVSSSRSSSGVQGEMPWGGGNTRSHQTYIQEAGVKSWYCMCSLVPMVKVPGSGWWAGHAVVFGTFTAVNAGMPLISITVVNWDAYCCIR